MAVQPKTEVLDVADLGAALAQFQAEDRKWKQSMEGHVRGLQAARSEITKQASAWVTMDDVKWGAGGAALGGGAAYVGATQGWWELTPLNVGIGVGVGGGVGVLAGRLLKKDD